jgi:branched-chain amino acid transport system permease protein
MDYVLSVLIFVSIYLVLASSLNLVLGHAGLLSLSHAAFYGIGAYVSALTALRFGWTFGPSALAAAAVAALLAAILAVPSMKLRGDYFILGSLGFQVIIHDVLYNWDAVTNGPWGLSGIPHPRLLGATLTSNLEHLRLYLPVAVASLLAMHWVSRAPFGKVLNAIREDEVATVALGKDVRSFRVRAFAFASALAAVAGAMYAHYVTYIDPTSFTFVESVYILSLVVVGGAGNTRGPILGAVVLVILPELLRFVALPSTYASNVRQIIYGLMLVSFILLRPKGLAGEDIF